MTTKYTRNPNIEDFCNWAKENPFEAKQFFEDYILDILLELEQDDYFGTEGFDKRFS